MKGKKRLIALLLSFLMVLSQMSVATFALDTVADENSDQTVEEQAVEETQPEADVKTAALETEPAATEPAAEETAAEPEAAQPAAAEPAKSEPAKAEEKKAEPEKAEAKEEAFDQSQTVDGVTVNVSAGKGVFPAGSKLSVSKVAVPGAVDTSDAEEAYAFDISILANGEKIQPDGNAKVSFTTAGAAGYDASVYHMDGGAQKMSVSESGNTASVKTAGFSVYVYVLKLVDTLPSGNTYSGAYNAKPEDEITLKDIINGIDGIDAYDNAGRLKRIKSVSVDDTGALTLVSGSPGDKLNEVKFKIKENASDGAVATITAEISQAGSYSKYTKHVISVTLNKGIEVSFNPGNAAGDPDFEADTMPETQYVASGDKATEPESEPVWKNHTFEGWYLNDEPFNFEETAISQNTELTAHWSHKHEWNRRRSDDLTVLYVKCTVPDCPYSEEKSLTVDAPNMVYTGDPYDPNKIALDLETGFYEEFGAQIGEIEKYTGKTLAGVKYDSTNPPTEAGNYKVHVKVTNNKPAHNWLWGSFSITPAKIKVTEPQAKLGLEYDGSEQLLADDGTLDPTGIATLKYAVSEEDVMPTEGYESSLEDLKKTDAGTYYVWYKPYKDGEVFDDPNYMFVDADGEEIDFDEEEPVEVIIDKADSEIVEDPTAKTLTYNGSAQPLVTAGEAEGGTMEYVIGKNDTDKPEDGWSADIPKGTDVGDYYVWYRVKGDKNHYDTYAEKPVKAVINKADPKITPPVGKTMTYNGQAQELVTAGTTTGGTMVYALGKDAKTVPEETANWTTSVPKGTEVGTYYIWYVVVGDKNYNPGPAPACVTSQIVPRQFTISYDLNGGKLNGQTGKVTVTVDEGTVITLPAPTRDGYKFDYWEGSKYNAGDKYTVTGDHTFKAVWKANSKGVNTGDSNDIAGLMALMIASIGALGAIGYRRRKEDQ